MPYIGKNTDIIEDVFCPNRTSFRHENLVTTCEAAQFFICGILIGSFDSIDYDVRNAPDIMEIIALAAPITTLDVRESFEIIAILRFRCHFIYLSAMHSHDRPDVTSP